MLPPMKTFFFQILRKKYMLYIRYYFSISNIKKIVLYWLIFWFEKLNPGFFSLVLILQEAALNATLLNQYFDVGKFFSSSLSPISEVCYRHHQSPPQPSQIIMWLRYSISFLSTFFSEFFQGKDFNLDPIITWFWVFTCVCCKMCWKM